MAEAAADRGVGAGLVARAPAAARTAEVPVQAAAPVLEVPAAVAATIKLGRNRGTGNFHYERPLLLDPSCRKLSLSVFFRFSLRFLSSQNTDDLGLPS